MKKLIFVVMILALLSGCGPGVNYEPEVEFPEEWGKAVGFDKVADDMLILFSSGVIARIDTHNRVVIEKQLKPVKNFGSD